MISRNRNLIACLALTAVLGATAGLLFRSPATTSAVTIGWQIQVGAEQENESYRRRFVKADGTFDSEKIFYTNGDIGTRTLVDGVQTELSVVNTQGVRRALFKSGEHGIESGFMIRANGTLVWDAERLNKDKIRWRYFWQDGTTVFLDEVIDYRAQESVGLYYRENGQLWMRRHYSTLFELTTLEQVFGEDGLLVYSINGDLHQSVITYYQAGVPHFRQTWVTIRDDEDEAPPRPMLTMVADLSTDGISRGRTLSANLALEPKIDMFSVKTPEGGVVRTWIYPDNSVKLVIRVDAANKEISRHEYKQGERQAGVSFAADFVRPAPRFTPSVTWAQKEGSPDSVAVPINP